MFNVVGTFPKVDLSGWNLHICFGDVRHRLSTLDCFFFYVYFYCVLSYITFFVFWVTRRFAIGKLCLVGLIGSPRL